MGAQPPDFAFCFRESWDVFEALRLKEPAGESGSWCVEAVLREVIEPEGDDPFFTDPAGDDG